VAGEAGLHKVFDSALRPNQIDFALRLQRIKTQFDLDRLSMFVVDRNPV
jgi:hypothetical protein